MTRVLILGATSGIARAVAAVYARAGSRLYLVGRDGARMAVLAVELAALGGGDVRQALADLSRSEAQGTVLDDAWSAFGGFDRVILAWGVTPDESVSRADWRIATEALRINLSSVVTMLDRLLERAGSGTDVRIGVIGSVAGDRGRARVANYAAAKGGLERYVEALQQVSNGGMVRFTIIKPGWVRTPMTAGKPPSPLIVSPERAATAIVRALDRGVLVAYVPWWWGAIMFAVRMIPRPLFRRLGF